MIDRTWLDEMRAAAPGTERTKHGREERHALAQLRAPWALVARRAGVLLRRIQTSGGPANGPVAIAAGVRFLEARRTARMLATLAAHEPLPEGWTRRD